MRIFIHHYFVQRDLTAEQAAERLRALSEVHYKER